MEDAHSDDSDGNDSDWSPTSSHSADDAFFFSDDIHAVLLDQTIESGVADTCSTHNTTRPEPEWLWGPLIDVNDIRVFCLHDAKDDKPTDPVQGYFRILSLDSRTLHEQLPYAALSYAWGLTYPDGSHLTHTIVIDGSHFRVTAHLHAALRALQNVARSDVDETNTTAIWIDAICIDQHNLLERSRQVMLMGQIYSNATKLYVWLGELNASPSPIDSIDMAILVDDVAKDLPSEKKDSFVSSLRHRPYFQRRWFIQEVISCVGPVSLLIGEYQLGATNLDDVLTQSGTRITLTPGTSTALSPEVRCHEDQRPSYSPKPRHPLLHNLIKYVCSLCSDDRNRVYALKNISSDGQFFPVDYRQSPGEVYTTLASKYILAGHIVPIPQSAAFLRLHDLPPGSRLEAELPTWVPDWRYNHGSPRTPNHGVASSIAPPSRTLTCSLCVPEPRQVAAMLPEIVQQGTTSFYALKLYGHLFLPCQHEGSDRTRRERSYAAKAFFRCGWCFMAAHDLAAPEKDFRDSFSSRAGTYYCVLGDPPALFILKRRQLIASPMQEETFDLVGYNSELELRNDLWYSSRINEEFPVSPKWYITLM